MAVSVPANRRMKNPIVAEDRRAGLVFIAPAMLIFGVFIFGAILFAFYVSFNDYQLLAKGGIAQLFTHPGKPWVGLDNYREIIHNSDFWIAFRNTSLVRDRRGSGANDHRADAWRCSPIARFAARPFSAPPSISLRSAHRS